MTTTAAKKKSNAKQRTKKVAKKKVAKKKVAKKKVSTLRQSSRAAKYRRESKQMAGQALTHAKEKVEEAVEILHDVLTRIVKARIQNAKHDKYARPDIRLPLWLTRTKIRESMALLDNAQQTVEAAQSGWEGDAR